MHTRRGRDAAGAGRTAEIIGGALLVVIAVAGASVLGWAWSGDPASNTLRYEAAKTAMQVIAVAFIGALATLATFTLQQARLHRAQDRDQEKENDRREFEHLRDRRARQDDLIRSLLTETLTSYNAVKRVRRLLVAETRAADGGPGLIGLDGYDRHLSSLIDQQLQFEQFKRLAPFLDDERLQQDPGASRNVGGPAAKPAVPLKTSYADIEKFLNLVIDEYKVNRQRVAVATSGVPVDSLATLSKFLGPPFMPSVANHVDRIIDVLQNAVLQPLAPPDAG